MKLTPRKSYVDLTYERAQELGCAWSARCNCYAGHSSNSGRCHTRRVVDPTRRKTEVAICESCRKHCDKGPGGLYEEHHAEALAEDLKRDG